MSCLLLPTNQQQSDRSHGLNLIPALAGTAGHSILSGQQVVFTEVAGLLIGGAYGRLGGGGVLILFTSIQLRKDNKNNGHFQVCGSVRVKTKNAFP